MLDYKLLEAFALVIDTGGFEKAAQKLNLTQSAVSQRVKMLEELTGQILLIRTLPPSATDPGLRLLAHYRKVKLLEEELAPAPSRETTPPPRVLALGVNADSLATWFLEAASDACENGLILDLHVDDQEQTHTLLQNGMVCGCVSTSPRQLQGCRVELLGHMEYGLFCTPHFAEKWFPVGFQLDAVPSAPTILFNRQDNLNKLFFSKFFGREPISPPTFYIPSSEKFVDCIARGLCYGLLPTQQSRPLCRQGLLFDLAPCCRIEIELHFHRWNLKIPVLEDFTGSFVARARNLLRVRS